ncbi:putative quinol monooxygenase [Chryseobacterium mucoviscidosis]|uniref:Antibiotic biosynthesis monooxygenase n=1 Tax=Chryseobacterium mucoviscidosis TaxID=1945581 RepID=A0A202C6I1_9FLAO|nr:putative quinol monooxygenase [Chryseobacterium mucoviscidosis]OVE59387.1 antibiotic biosynthesis monooxygenase [Chryseobacterium mucoviscidosis]
MKIYLTAVIKAREEYRAEVLEVLQNMVKETVKEEANELYRLHQGIEDKNQFVFYEIWKSSESLAQHNEQPYIKAFRELVNEKLQEQPQIFLTEII